MANVQTSIEPKPIVGRPPIATICFMAPEGHLETITVGNGGITDIREVLEKGSYDYVPWLEVWSGDTLIARFNQHKVECIFYR